MSGAGGPSPVAMTAPWPMAVSDSAESSIVTSARKTVPPRGCVTRSPLTTASAACSPVAMSANGTAGIPGDPSFPRESPRMPA
jgi:hypothetical protein